MITNRLLIAGVLSLVIFLPTLVAAQEQAPPPYVGSEGFERMKLLAGSWEGMMDMGKETMKVTTNYRVTSNGSALIETVFAGAPHEMVTVYHDDSHHQVNFTHYCSLGNQPKMTLTSMNGDTLSFSLSQDSDIDEAHDQHMHAAAVTFNGNDKITQQWTKSEPGKPMQVVKVTYSRIK